MTARAQAWRDGVVLPWLLMGVALAASLRVTIEGELRVLPPPLSALVLAVLMMAVLVRCGQLVLPALVADGRTGIQTASGVAVIVTLGWASAAVIALVTPEAGLPKLAGLILATALIANTLAASASRLAALRALFVACAAGFVVKFIVLDALYQPSQGLAGRMVTALLDGVTLGAFGHVPWAPITGYLAFCTVILYFVALFLLPRPAVPLPPARTALDSPSQPPARVGG